MKRVERCTWHQKQTCSMRRILGFGCLIREIVTPGEKNGGYMVPFGSTCPSQENSRISTSFHVVPYGSRLGKSLCKRDAPASAPGVHPESPRQSPFFGNVGPEPLTFPRPKSRRGAASFAAPATQPCGRQRRRTRLPPEANLSRAPSRKNSRSQNRSAGVADFVRE